MWFSTIAGKISLSRNDWPNKNQICFWRENQQFVLLGNVKFKENGTKNSVEYSRKFCCLLFFFFHLSLFFNFYLFFIFLVVVFRLKFEIFFFRSLNFVPIFLFSFLLVSLITWTSTAKKFDRVHRRFKCVLMKFKIFNSAVNFWCLMLYFPFFGFIWMGFNLLS